MTMTRAWIMWCMALTFVLFQFSLQLSSSILAQPLMHSFAITALGASLISSSYYYVYVILQVPAGILVDWFGARKLTAIGGMICAFGCLLFADAHHVWLAEIGRLFMGLGTAFAFVTLINLTNCWFPQEKVPFMIGLAESLGMAGTIVANMFLAAIIQTASWQASMFGAAVIALIIANLGWFIIRDKKTSPLDPERASIKFKSIFFAIVKDLRFWVNGLYAGLLFSVITVFVALWEVPYLISALGINIKDATLISSSSLLGISIGSFFIGKIYDNLKRHRPLLVVVPLIMAALMTWIIYFPLKSLWGNLVIMFFVGMGCSIYVINYSLANYLAEKNGRSTAIGFTNFLCLLTAPLLQPLIGFFINLTSSPVAIKTHQYTLQSFHYALIVVPLVLITASILAFFIPRKNQLNLL